MELRKHVLDLNLLLSQMVELMRDRPEAKECALTLELPPTPLVPVPWARRVTLRPVRPRVTTSWACLALSAA